MKGVWVALGQLFDRLPRLLKDRTSWSKRPDSAYPLTIRLTVRVVDECLRSAKRRPFVTRSAQCRFDGQRLLQTKELTTQGDMIKLAVTPLVRQLLGSSSSKDIDVTRLNIAVTNFQDIPELCKAAYDGRASSTLKIAFQGRQKEKNEKMIRGPTKTKPNNLVPTDQTIYREPLVLSGSKKVEYERSRGSRASSAVAAIQRQDLPLNDSESRTNFSTKIPSQKRQLFTTTNEKRYNSVTTTSSSTRDQHCNEIDPTFLAALPPDIAEEVRRTYQQQQRQQQQQSKKTKIDHFFGRKRT